MKWLGDNANGKNAHFTRNLRNHWRGACSCAATHASRHKAHMRAMQLITNFVTRFLCRRTTNFWLRACAQTLGNLKAHLNDTLSLR